MKRHLLRLLIAALLTAGGVAISLFLLPEKLTIMAGAPPRRAAPKPPRPDRTGEVLAEIDEVRAVLRAFAQNLDGAATQRDTIAQRLAALEASTPGEARIANVERRLDDWGTRLYSALKAASSAKPPETKTKPKPAAPKPAPKVVAKATPKAVEAPAPKKRPSLAALLAKRKRKDPRDERTRYRLLPGYCRVGFDGSSTIHNFTAKSDAVSGDFHLHVNQPNDRPAGTISVAVNTLDSGNKDRDEEIHTHLSGGGHARIRCEVLGFEKPLVARKGAFEARARVRFTIHGRSREVKARVKVEFTRTRILHVSGEVKLKMSDFGIRPKAKLGLVSVDDAVTAWWDLNAEVHHDKT